MSEATTTESTALQQLKPVGPVTPQQEKPLQCEARAKKTEKACKQE